MLDTRCEAVLMAADERPSDFNDGDAEEVTQDPFVRAHRSLALFRGESSLSSWLHCIALNLARHRYWYFFRRSRHLTESLDRAASPHGSTTVAELTPSPAPDPAREASYREFSAIVTECITRLNAPQQGILQLRAVQHQSYQAIARILAISPGTVKSRVFRARQNLRALLAKAYSSSSDSCQPPTNPWFESVRALPRASVPQH